MSDTPTFLTGFKQQIPVIITAGLLAFAGSWFQGQIADRDTQNRLAVLEKQQAEQAQQQAAFSQSQQQLATQQAVAAESQRNLIEQLRDLKEWEKRNLR